MVVEQLETISCSDGGSSHPPSVKKRIYELGRKSLSALNRMLKAYFKHA